MGGAQVAAQLEWWRQRLGGLTALNLPLDRPRPAVPSGAGDRVTREIPADLAAALTALAQRHSVTLFMALLAAFQTLLMRWTGQTDFGVSSPVAGRNWPEVEPLIGLFVNSLVLRADLSGNPTFAALLGRVRDHVSGALARQDVPFDKLVEELQIDRSLSRSIVEPVAFALQNVPSEALTFPDARTSTFPIDRTTSRYDLCLFVQESTGRLLAIIEYNTDLFERSTVERMAAAFCTLLRGVVAAPETRVDALPLVSAGERGALVAAGTGPAGGAPAGATIAGMLAAQMGARPGAVALEAGGATWTYAALGAAAGQVAGALRAAGVGPNVPVGIWLPREAGLLITVAGDCGGGRGVCGAGADAAAGAGGEDVGGDGGARGGDGRRGGGRGDGARGAVDGAAAGVGAGVP